MADLYKSDDWLSLDKIGRAQLLPVIEGLKRGMVYKFGNRRSLMKILERTGLAFEFPNRDPQVIDPMISIAKPEVLMEESGRILSLPGNATFDDMVRIWGWTLGYPACCTEEYIRKPTPEEAMAWKSDKRFLSSKFGRELHALIKSEGKYPEIFDYAPPSFTPCGIDCPEAKKMLTSYKQAIDQLDSEAGEELKYINRKNQPNRLVHDEYMREKRRKDYLEYTERIGEILSTPAGAGIRTYGNLTFKFNV